MRVLARLLTVLGVVITAAVWASHLDPALLFRSYDGPPFATHREPLDTALAGWLTTGHVTVSDISIGHDYAQLSDYVRAPSRLKPNILAPQTSRGLSIG